MKLTMPTFERLTELTSEIETELEEFNQARDEYEEAEDSEDREQARTSALEALDAILGDAAKLGELRSRIEE